MTEFFELRDVAQLLADRTAAAITTDDLNSALGLVVQTAVDVGVCEEASITQRRRDGTLETVAPTGELVVMADKLQYELGEGPCVRAIYQDGLLACPDVATDPRWPRWGPAAADLGIGGLISAHLHSDSRAAAALNLYSRQVRVHDTAKRQLIRLIATHAQIALAHARGKSHLWKAIDSRHTIGMAQGILLTKYQITGQTAFGLLRRISQDNNVKLHDVAVHVTRTGTLPESRSQQDPHDAGGS